MIFIGSVCSEGTSFESNNDNIITEKDNISNIDFRLVKASSDYELRIFTFSKLLNCNLLVLYSGDHESVDVTVGFFLVDKEGSNHKSFLKDIHLENNISKSVKFEDITAEDSTYYVYVKIDPFDEFIEYNENNNLLPIKQEWETKEYSSILCYIAIVIIVLIIGIMIWRYRKATNNSKNPPIDEK